ncbi:unnamed protein product [Auanema sp. JU1783]|nr:unnamed protein product [Auanema sp. JU1783]
MSELIGVIMSGGIGNRMRELCENIPKSLLPVAGVPIFWYSINTLARAGVKDIRIFFRDSIEAEVRNLMSTSLFEFEGVVIKPFFIDKDHDWGTADVLREYIGKIDRDVVIISGDFVSDASLRPMIDLFRAHKATLCCLLSDHCVTGPVPGPKIKRSKGRDFVARVIDPNRLVFLSAEEDFDCAVDGYAWMKKFPNITLTSTLNDCHVYVIRHGTLNMLAAKKGFASIKADFIPYLLDQQNSSKNEDNVKCLAYVLPHENGTVTAHANNIASYFEINKAIIKSLLRVSPKMSVGQQFEYRSTRISCAESRVDEDAQINAGSVIKRSSIGARCFLDEKAKVQNSLLMEGARVGKNAIVTNSILCSDVEIEDGADVSNCIISPRQKVSANTKVQNEFIDTDDINDDWANDC